MRDDVLTSINKRVLQDSNCFLLYTDVSGVEIPKSDRILVEGICEANIIGMASGIASENNVVYVNGLACFLVRRAYEHIYIDVGLHNFPVRIVGTAAGSSIFNMGRTHQIYEDFTLMNTIENMSFVIPSSAKDMICIDRQIGGEVGPVYYRLSWDERILRPEISLEFGVPSIVKNGRSWLIIYSGPMYDKSLKVANYLGERGNDCSIVYLHSINSETNSHLKKMIESFDNIVSIEDHYVNAGIGDYIFSCINSNSITKKVFKKIGIKKIIEKKYESNIDLLNTNLCGFDDCKYWS